MAVIQFSFAYSFLKPEQSGVSLLILGLVFLATRAAQLDSNKMVRNIIVVVLLLVTVLFIVYTNIKATEAEKRAISAVETFKVSQEHEAQIYEEMAHLERQLHSLENQLKNCKGNE
ncbi:MAG: hypothetical protein KY428_11170 [Bacteroidetes bacterium]|nr:hypothetical protein [Bacteroidota bacterium]